MKRLLKIFLAIMLLTACVGIAILQNWISDPADAYLVFFAVFAVFTTWVIFKVLTTVSRHNESLIACPKCKMRTDSLREECMWCDQGLPES
ncbi:MAG: hypothetical protein WA071_05905 [Undibacterium umbellatum]|uniref:hypothetical protein n=1 Tax=Undibacterium umbellatum TaxID=2762300 RepID=UPI003BB64B7B